MNWRLFDSSLGKLSMTVNYVEYKDGKIHKEMFIIVTSEKETRKSEGSIKVLNMDTICYRAEFKSKDN